MSKQISYLQHVLDTYPTLHVSTSQLLEDGFVNDILILNESLIFRFPRSAEGVMRMAREVAVLHAIQNQITFTVPHPIFCSRDQQTIGQVFMGYTMIGGEPIKRHLNTIVPGIACTQIAIQLATFLKELHEIKPVLNRLDLPNYMAGRREGLVEMYGQIRTHLYPLMRDTACASLTALFDQFLSTPLNFQCDTVLRHGDLNPNNILFDAHQQQVCGIIDFGSTGLDDPAIDLGMVASWGRSIWGDPFVETFLDKYQVSDRVRKRVQFYRAVLSLMAAFEGLETGDQETLAFSLAEYR